MSRVTVKWNPGMSVALGLLLIGGVLIVVADGVGTPLHVAGLGIVGLSALVYLGSRIWTLTRRIGR